MNSKTLLFYEKCRLCLQNLGVSNISEMEDLQQEILVCTGVTVHPLDNLPQKICSACLKTVKKASALRLLATQNDAHIRTLFDIDSDDEPRLVIHEPEPEIEDKSPEKKCIKRKRKRLFSTESEENGKNNKIIVKTKEEYMNAKKAVQQEDESDRISFECEVCGRTYESWKKLYLHNRLHIKKLQCPLDGCEKKFAYKADLEKHLRTHTGVKPFACEICDKAFTQRVTLKSHKATVHHCYTD